MSSQTVFSWHGGVLCMLLLIALIDIFPSVNGVDDGDIFQSLYQSSSVTALSDSRGGQN